MVSSVNNAIVPFHQVDLLPGLDKALPRLRLLRGDVCFNEAREALAVAVDERLRHHMHGVREPRPPVEAEPTFSHVKPPAPTPGAFNLGAGLGRAIPA